MAATVTSPAVHRSPPHPARESAMRVCHPTVQLIAAGFALTATLAFASRAHAQTWNEAGDAGDLPATAQVTTGAGALTSIHGNLASPSDVDMYCIHVPDPAGVFICL